MVRDTIRRYVEAAQSLTELPRDRAERVAKRLAGSGLIDRDQIRTVTSDLVERSRDNRRRLTNLVTKEIRRQVSKLGLASKDDVERLRQRVQALEASSRTRTTRTATTRKPSSTATRTRKRPAAPR